jgi:predicted nucleotidyltransferase
MGEASFSPGYTARRPAVPKIGARGTIAAVTAAEATRFADGLARSSAGALGERRIAAAILHGSLTLGDYVPGRSDIDLLVVVEDSPSDAALGALVDAARSARRRAGTRVDLRVVSRSVAAAATPTPPMEAYVELRPGAEPGVHVETRVPVERDLVVELSVCRAHGRSLLGASPASVIGEIPGDWVLDVGNSELARWQALEYERWHAELIVLTTCRVWHFAEERRHSAKSEAAEWALRRDPSLQAVRGALRQRHGDSALPIEEADVRELLALARSQIASSRRRPRVEAAGA